MCIYLTETPRKRPIPADADMWTVEEKSTWLQAEAKKFLNDIVLKQEDFTDRVSNLDEAHREGFPCHSPSCEIIFSLHSSRVRYSSNIQCVILLDFNMIIIC